MTLDIAIILGVVQALTEFLPVSSSGHLVVFQTILDADNASVAFDVFLHLATLLVVIVYLRREIFQILKALVSKDQNGTQARTLVLLVLLATIPGAVVGLGFKDLIHQMFKSPKVVSVGFFITTALLLAADRKQQSARESLTTQDKNTYFDWPLPSFLQALLIGIAQAIAITPGISRSGSTIAASLLLCLPVKTALKFSFLISVPAILGAGLLEAKALGNLPADDFSIYLAGFFSAAFVGFFALKMLILVTNNKSLKYFAIYTFILAVAAQFI